MSTSELRNRDGLSIFRTDRDHNFRFPSARCPRHNESERRLSHTRSSDNHGGICRDMLVGRGEHDLPLSSEQSYRIRAAAGGHSCVLVLESPYRIAIGEFVTLFCEHFLELGERNMTGSREEAASRYLAWAKLHSNARFNLAISGVLDYPLSELPVQIEDLEIGGTGPYGYKPLMERLAAKAGVPEDCVVYTLGTSMANYIALTRTCSPRRQGVD